MEPVIKTKAKEAIPALIREEIINIFGKKPNIGGIPPKLKSATTRATSLGCEGLMLRREILLESMVKEEKIGIIVEIRNR